jgi:enoyl-CoA hydratase/carnithine racemase
MASSKQAHLHPAQGLLIVRTVYSLTGATMTEFCIVEKADHIMTVRINRPDRLNALHPPGNAELGEVFDDFDADDDMWVAIITGEGRGFSAGNDLRHQAEGGERVATPRGFGGLSSRFDMQKPVIAAVNGVAMGGGFEIALSCDLIIASDKALFALPEPKVGLAALAGG